MDDDHGVVRKPLQSIPFPQVEHPSFWLHRSPVKSWNLVFWKWAFCPFEFKGSGESEWGLTLLQLFRAQLGKPQGLLRARPALRAGMSTCCATQKVRFGWMSICEMALVRFTESFPYILPTPGKTSSPMVKVPVCELCRLPEC